MSTDLDDVPALTALDPGDLLRALAGGAAQVREAAVLAAEAGVAALADEGRPRAVLVCGTGSSAAAGDLLEAVAGAGSPSPVLTWRGQGLPAWAGAADLVVAVSAPGDDPQAVGALEEAVRRGCRLLVVGARDSPLAELGARGRAVVVPVTQGRLPQAQLWSLAVPLLAAGHALGLVPGGPAQLEEAAEVLEQVATRCRPDADTVVNPAKTLAAELTGTLPVVWGASALAGAAARRFAGQLAETAALPATWGVLPEAGAGALRVLDGSWASPAHAGDDFFRDREDDVERVGLRVVLLREPGEHPQAADRADAYAELALERGVPVTRLQAEGESAVARLASLIATADVASAYLALLEGTDPTAVPAVDALKGRTSR